MDPSESGIAIIEKLTFEVWVGLLIADETIPKKSVPVDVTRMKAFNLVFCAFPVFGRRCDI